MTQNGPVHLDAVTRRFALRCAALIVSLVAAACVFQMWFTPAKRMVRRHLAEADRKSEVAISKDLEPLVQLFAKGRQGSRPFAEEALSWGGKWALVKGFIPYGDGDAHRKFLAEAFSRHVIDRAEFEGALQGSLTAYLTHLEEADNEMLVRLRADVADLGGTAPPSFRLGDEAFRKEYRRLVAEVAGTIRVSTAVEAATQAGNFVASEIVTVLAVQAAAGMAAEMGVEAGVLGAGAASTVATLGIGLIVSLVIDQIIDAVFKAVGYDPVEKIAGQVNASLDKMEKALLEDAGTRDGGKASLRTRMRQIHETRSLLRHEAVAKLLKGGSK